MRFNKITVILILMSLNYAIFELNGFSQDNEDIDRVWFDTNLSIEERSVALVEAMTLEEKISQLMDQSPAIPRLAIPEYNWWNECLHGLARNGRATVFPQAIGLAATFDEELIYKIGSAISDEARAKFNIAIKNGNRSRYAGLTFWSPNVNIYRDPRWGRGQETYGEDPYLTSRMGVNFVKGLQGNNPNYLKVAACAKHYVVHSGPEALRHEFNAKVSPKDLWETYLPAFRALVTEAEVEGVMGAYNRTNGEACCASPYLLNTILKDKWGFDGYIVSDCGAISNIYKEHNICETPEEAASLAIKAGLQLNCGRTFEKLGRAIQKGLITEVEIDSALIQLLKTRFKLGLFDPFEDNPYNKIPPEAVGSDKHVQLALEAAQKSIVLVKNNNNVLPLNKNIRTLFVTGPQAANSDVLLGNYYGLANHTVNILDGIVSKVSISTSVNYKYGQLPYRENVNPIDWTTGKAKSYDATIAVMGISNLWEGEEGESLASYNKGDHTDAKLPQPQINFLKKLKKDNEKPLIVVLTGGYPMSIPDIYDIADAIVYCWYPGQQGGKAVADILFGDVSPSGRMPFTVPVDIKKLPPYDDYSLKGRTYRYMTDNVLFPFGFGLSYTKFEYGNLELKKQKINDKELVEFTLNVLNTGNFGSDEVIQVYVSQPGDNVPRCKLINIRRIHLKKGQSQKMEFLIDLKKLTQVNEIGEEILLKGKYKLWVGSSSPTISTVLSDLTKNFLSADFVIE